MRHAVRILRVNSALLSEKEVREELAKSDIVKVSQDMMRMIRLEDEDFNLLFDAMEVSTIETTG